MKKLLIGLFVFGSLSSFANETIKKPRFDGAKFTCASKPEAVCNALGYEFYVDGTVKCTNYKTLGFLSVYEPYQDHAFAPGKTDLISAELNTYRNSQPTLFDGVKDNIRAHNQKYVFYNAIGSVNSKVIKKITCEGLIE